MRVQLPKLRGESGDLEASGTDMVLLFGSESGEGGTVFFSPRVLENRRCENTLPDLACWGGEALLLRPWSVADEGSGDEPLRSGPGEVRGEVSGEVEIGVGPPGGVTLAPWAELLPERGRLSTIPPCDGTLRVRLAPGKGWSPAGLEYG